MKRILLFLTCILTLFGVARAEKVDCSFDAPWSPAFSGNAYSAHSLTTNDYEVKLSSASKQSGTITDCPVIKAGDIEIIVKNGKPLKSVKFNFKAWNNKSTTANVYYSTNGGSSYTQLGSQIDLNNASYNYIYETEDLTSKGLVNAIKITKVAANQAGLSSIEYTYDENTEIVPVAPSEIIFTPSAGTIDTKTKISFGVDEAASLPVKFEYSIDSQSYDNTYSDPFCLDEGSHTVYVKATNEAGSISSSATYNVEKGPACYTIVFGDNGSDDSSVIAEAALKNYIIEGGEYVASLTPAYLYKGSTGLKFGSSSNKGSLTITLSTLGKLNATQLVVNAATYGSDNSGLQINNTTAQSLTSDFKDYTLDLDGSVIETIKLDVTGKRGYVKSITVYYKEDSNLEKPSISFDATELNVTLNQENISWPSLTSNSDAAPVYKSSRPAVATVDETSGAVEIKGLGSTTITATVAETETFAASEAKYIINVSPEEGTTITVAQALEALSNEFSGTVQVSGKISEIKEVSVANGNATYYIKDDLDSGESLQVYRGKWLNGDNFTSEDQLEVGASVVVEGELLLYNNNTPEINTGNKLISYKAPNGTKVTLEWNGEVAYELEMNSAEGFELPELNISSIYEIDEDAVKALIRYKVSNPNIAILNEDATSVTFDLSNAGTVIVTAYLEENDDYRADEVSFSLKVYNPNVISDVITMEALGEKTGTSYKDHTISFDDKGDVIGVDDVDYSNAERVYSTKTAFSGGTVQLRSSSSDSGIAVIANKGYRAVSVTLDWDTKQTAATNRTIDIYANEIAYTAPSDLYGTTGNTNQGKKVGSISIDNNETTYFFDSDAIYKYIGIRSYNGAIYLNSITIEWEKIEELEVSTDITWDSEWTDVVELEGLEFTMDGEDATSLVTTNEIYFEFRPTWTPETTLESSDGHTTVDGDYFEVIDDHYDYEEGTIMVTFPCSGLYEVYAHAKHGYVINGKQSVLVGTANIYPSLSGFKLSVDPNIDSNDDYEWTLESNNYVFTTASDEDGNPKDDWFHDARIYPLVSLDAEGVEVWYKIHLTPTQGDGTNNTEDSLGKSARRAAADPAALGFTKAENDVIDLGPVTAATNSATQISLILVKNNAATPMDAVQTDQSVHLITLETTSEATGVESVVVGVGEGEVIYFDLNGRRVLNPDKGIFIKVEAGKVSKVIL